MSQNRSTAEVVPSSVHLVGPSQNENALAGGEDPWKLKIVLTLDGGGVRGYGSLLMLQELMREVERIEREYPGPDGRHDTSFAPYKGPKRHPREQAPPIEYSGAPPDLSNSRAKKTKSNNLTTSPLRETGQTDKTLKPSLSGYLPCHYFDYIGGTSTGGLNAIMLGRLRMSVDQCVGHYPDMASNIFPKPRHQFKGWPQTKYDGKNLENAIKDVASARSGNPEELFRSPDDLCRTFVMAKKKQGIISNAYIFRSYDNPESETPDSTASRQPIWKIGRATAAAPTFFGPIQMNDELYSDGGVGYNNPAEVGYWEVLHKERYRKGQPEPLRLFLSIGTGGEDSNINVHGGPAQDAEQPTGHGNTRSRLQKLNLYRHLHDQVTGLKYEVTEVNKVHTTMRNLSAGGPWPYFRWTGGKGLAKLKMDKWNPAKRGRSGTKEDIEKQINEYMTLARKKEVEAVARLLVDVRRQRIKHDGGDTWQRFTYCSLLPCPVCCKNDYSIAGTVAKLAKHLQTCDPEGEYDASKYGRWPPKIDGGPC